MRSDDQFDARLRQMRRLLGWTQQELADWSGVGVTIIQRLEDHGFEPGFSTATALADTMGVQVTWLLTGEGPTWQGERPAQENRPYPSGQPKSEGRR